MVDLSDKVFESEDMNNSSSQITSPERVSSNGGTYLKTCADCGTTKTPLWRGGPAGPKSLCNACGIRSRKKRRALLGLINKEDKKSKKSRNNGQQNQQQNNDKNNTSSSTSNNSRSRSGDQNSSNSNSNAKSRIVDISMKRKLLTFGRDVALQRPRSSSTSQRRKLREEEQAAFLLMALSCGSVYA